MQVLDLLKKSVEDGASDLFILAGSPATQKVEGHIVQMNSDRLLPNDTRLLIEQIYELAHR